jgi:hypothetical protein
MKLDELIKKALKFKQSILQGMSAQEVKDIQAVVHHFTKAKV